MKKPRWKKDDDHISAIKAADEKATVTLELFITDEVGVSSVALALSLSAEDIASKLIVNKQSK